MKRFVKQVLLALSICLILLCSVVFLLPKTPAKGDSGFDADYDYYDSYDSGSSYSSGGSYSGGGSYSSGGSYYDSDYSYSSSSSSSSNSSSGGSSGSIHFKSKIWEAVFYIGLIAIFFSPLIVMGIVEYKSNHPKVYKRSSIPALKGPNPEPINRPPMPYPIFMNQTLANELCNMAYESYKEIQVAWMDKDLDRIQHLVTDELYNMYKMQIETLNYTHQKNIMKDFSYLQGYVSFMQTIDYIETVKIVLGVRCKDYIIDEDSQKVIKGDSKSFVKYFYELTFVKDITKRVLKCPNCKGELLDQMSARCPHCDTPITRTSFNYTLSNKRMLRQYKN